MLLDVGAVWCHWCHVMDEQTYRDATVVELVERRYLAVRVDQDAEPALSARYEQWGWPATVILRPDGVELVKFKGYVPPPRMASLLEAVLVDAETLWLALSRADAGEAREAGRARRTLQMALLLQDPEWGGFYQYSDRRDWRSPHHEQLISIQADAIALYSNAYARWGDPSFAAAARRAAAFLDRFLSGEEGAFFGRPVLYVCGRTSCSRPVFDPEQLRAALPAPG